MMWKAEHLGFLSFSLAYSENHLCRGLSKWRHPVWENMACLSARPCDEFKSTTGGEKVNEGAYK